MGPLRMEGVSPLLQFIFGGSLATVIVAIATIFSSRKLNRVSADAKIVESAGDQNDRLTAEVEKRTAERDEAQRESLAQQRKLRERDVLADTHDLWDRLMIAQARDNGLEVPLKPPLWPDGKSSE